MSKPNRNIVLSSTELVKETEVSKVKGLWIVLYQDEPFMITVSSRNKFGKRIVKYKNTVFSSEGVANSLAARLNYKFNTLEFTIQRLTI